MIGHDCRSILKFARVWVSALLSVSIANCSRPTRFQYLQATAYIRHSEAVVVNGDVSFGWNDYSGTRNIFLLGEPHRESQLQRAGLHRLCDNGLRFLLGFTILRSLPSSTHVIWAHTQTGADSVNLNGIAELQFLGSRLGVKVARPVPVNTGRLCLRSISAGFTNSITLTNTAAFAGLRRSQRQGLSLQTIRSMPASASPSSHARALRKHGRWRLFTITTGQVTDTPLSGIDQAHRTVLTCWAGWMFDRPPSTNGGRLTGPARRCATIGQKRTSAMCRLPARW